MELRAERRMIGVCAALGVSLSAVLSGCIYSNLPGETKNTLAATDPNIYPSPKLMALSLEYVVNRYPPPGGPGDGSTPTFAFNLPAGLRRENIELVQSMLGGRGVPVTPENAQTLPIYHIATMWIRGSRAQVEMVYPVHSIGLTPSAEPVYRGVSLELGSDLSPWYVRRQQLWNVGTIEVPSLHFFPDPRAETVAEEPVAEEPIVENAPVDAPQAPGSPVETQVLPAETIPEPEQPETSGGG